MLWSADTETQLMHALTHTCTQTHTDTHTHEHTYTYMYTHIGKHIHIMLAYTHTYKHVHTCLRTEYSVLLLFEYNQQQQFFVFWCLLGKLKYY